MRKLFLVFVFLLITLPVFAQIEAGQQMLDIRGSLGFQLNNSGIIYSNLGDRADWGTLGAEIGLSYYYFITEYFGFGADISYGDFDGGGDLSFSSSNKIDDKTKLYNLQLVGRLNIAPQNRVRLYIPFGFGLTASTQDLFVKYSGVQFDNKKTYLSPVLFVGAGLEFDVGQNGWAWGFETRYNTFWYDTEKLIKNAPATFSGDGNRRYEYITLQIHVSKKF